jgi:hypothetical protein
MWPDTRPGGRPLLSYAEAERFDDAVELSRRWA